ncbi:MAG: DUF4214 domain-containing protein, partial [Candidatus Competibacterales bacterium]
MICRQIGDVAAPGSCWSRRRLAALGLITGLSAIQVNAQACTTAAWATVVTDAADRLVTTPLAFTGQCGLAVALTDPHPRYVEDLSPGARASYAARFYVHIDADLEASLRMGEGLTLLRGFEADETRFQLDLVGQNDGLQLVPRPGEPDDDASPLGLAIGPGWVGVQLQWRTTDPVVNGLRTVVDYQGRSESLLLPLATETEAVLQGVRWGLVASDASDLAGQLTLDEFASWIDGATALVPSDQLAVDFDNDAMPDPVEGEEGTAFDLRDNDVFGDARLFIRQQYRDFLLREGDEPGIAFWADEFEQGRPQRELVIEFLLSPEFFSQVETRFPDPCGDFPATCGDFPELNDEDPPLGRYTIALYQGLLQRDPDPLGFDFWYRRFRDGEPLQALADAFLESPEYCRRFLDAVACPAEDRATPLPRSPSHSVAPGAEVSSAPGPDGGRGPVVYRRGEGLYGFDPATGHSQMLVAPTPGVRLYQPTRGPQGQLAYLRWRDATPHPALVLVHLQGGQAQFFDLMGLFPPPAEPRARGGEPVSGQGAVRVLSRRAVTAMVPLVP